MNEQKRTQLFIQEYAKNVAILAPTVIIGMKLLSEHIAEHGFQSWPHILGATIFVLGELVDVKTTIKNTDNPNIVELSPLLPAHPEKVNFIKKVLPYGVVNTVNSALFPPVGIGVGAIKIYSAYQNHILGKK